MISELESLPIYSEEYLDAQDVFYLQFNDVDIYVEDIDQEELYKEILSKILPFKIGKIFPLGGKLKVIQKATNNQNVKRKIFLVDKDFDDLHGNIVTIPNLFYLDKYCIENYLVSKKAIIVFLKEEFPKIPIEQIEQELDFEKIYNNTISELTELFIYFFLIQKLNLPLENCSCSVDRFIDDKAKHQIDNQKCLDLLTEIKKQNEIVNPNVSIENEKKH
jgi:hypothetical protein